MTEPSTPDRPPPSKRARVVSKLIAFAGLFHRAMTLGVRGLVIDPENRVLLVRHTYVPGFYLPGGGVERGETCVTSLERELLEEANVRLDRPPTLFGLYHNPRVSQRDHVALYVVRDFTSLGPRAPDREIAEAGFYALDALPTETTAATRARLDEALRGAEISPRW